MESNLIALSELAKRLARRSLEVVNPPKGQLLNFKFAQGDLSISTGAAAQMLAQQEAMLTLDRMIRMGELTPRTAMQFPAALPIEIDRFDRYFVRASEADLLIQRIFGDQSPAEAAPSAQWDHQGAETTEARRARRYQACIDAKLPLPDNDYAALPRGIGELAKREGITRQSFAEDVKAHIRALKGKKAGDR